MQVNDKVWVHAMGSYYAGEVVKITPKRVTVRYTSGAGKTRDKAVAWDPAIGAYAEKYCANFPVRPVVDGEPKPRGARQLQAGA